MPGNKLVLLSNLMAAAHCVSRSNTRLGFLFSPCPLSLFQLSSHPRVSGQRSRGFNMAASVAVILQEQRDGVFLAAPCRLQMACCLLLPKNTRIVLACVCPSLCEGFFFPTFVFFWTIFYSVVGKFLDMTSMLKGFSKERKSKTETDCDSRRDVGSDCPARQLRWTSVAGLWVLKTKMDKMSEQHAWSI